MNKQPMERKTAENMANEMWRSNFIGSAWLIELVGEGRAVRLPVYGEQTKQNADIVLRECRRKRGRKRRHGQRVIIESNEMRNRIFVILHLIFGDEVLRRRRRFSSEIRNPFLLGFSVNSGISVAKQVR